MTLGSERDDDSGQQARFRCSSDTKPPSLYWREQNGSAIVVPEPVDARGADWRLIAPNHVLVARQHAAVQVHALDAGAALLQPA